MAGSIILIASSTVISNLEKEPGMEDATSSW